MSEKDYTYAEIKSNCDEHQIKYQHTISDLYSSYSLNNYKNSITDNKELAFFVSLQDDSGLAFKWLETCPKNKEFIFLNDEYVAALRYRFHLKLLLKVLDAIVNLVHY